ncbi:tripartite tricarboxylate transporter permease [Paralimibaculum aggregatum]|uniref:Tripartite tricarboxylate transporter permease n=1 Tax=Paralimibaculum aggregatum TaxID=3036245 RepID=A0ABQ6LTU6_9RHOB|nr:tripartite tricarboxylate transporter permease [Limibaculum sp. NKW23]GMG85509.1 tripartite tricarboxylate transporter permease [Limibaculum sp. NKW23]
MSELFANISIGLANALTLEGLVYCFIGVLLGTVLGLIPGVGTLVALSLLFPFTYHLDPLPGLVMLAGIFYGTTYGGSTASILLNLPGTPANAVAAIEGYPMAQQGRAGAALFLTTIASFFGATVGITLMMAFSPLIVSFALQFGPQEYFSLMILGMLAASVISDSTPMKGVAMVVVGVMLGLVGMDVNSGVQRYTFGVLELFSGLSLVALTMGLFGIAEIIRKIPGSVDHSRQIEKISLRSMLPSRNDMKRSRMPLLRGAGVGAFFGTLPGTGGLIASFMAYATEKKFSREPERFGKGAVEGLVAPESANNAADQTAFIPTLTLGIPGSPAMAIMLTVLIVHGIAPGPRLVVNEPELFWGLIMSFWVGNLFLLVLNIPFIGLWVRILSIPFNVLVPCIVVLVCLGTYSVNNNIFDIFFVAGFGLFGLMCRYFAFPLAPVVLGFVLGPLLEEYFRRSLLIAGGDFSTFVTRPVSATFIAICAILVIGTVYATVRQLRRAKETL